MLSLFDKSIALEKSQFFLQDKQVGFSILYDLQSLKHSLQ